MAHVLPTTAPDRLTVLEGIPAPVWVIGLLLLLMPALANNFVLFQIFGWSFILGMIALSLMVLAGYGGMVSLIQMTVGALAGYVVAILGTSGVPQISLGWPWWLHIPLAILIATLFGTLVGALAVRTEGIYTIMITLAIAAAFFYFTRQNYTIFNGYTGFNNVHPAGPVRHRLAPGGAVLLSDARLRDAVLSGGRVDGAHAVRAGAARRARQPAAHECARLFGHRPSHSGLLVRERDRGGRRHPARLAERAGRARNGRHSAGDRHPGDCRGRWSQDARSARSSARSSTRYSACSRPIFCTRFGMSGERFKLVVGLGFLAVVFFSPDGVLGLWERYRSRAERSSRDLRPGGEAAP